MTLSLYWGPAIFCTQRVQEAFLDAGLRGVEFWPPILHRKNVPSETITQIVVPSVAGPGLAAEDKEMTERCLFCGVTRYRYHLRGYMHMKREAFDPELDFQQSHEWYGSGSRASGREIFISNRVARLILEQKWRGLRLKPVQLVCP